MSDAAPAKARRTKKIRHFFATPDGTVLEAMNKAVEKRSRDILTYHHGSELHEGVGQVTFINPQRPLGNKVLQPGLQSPLCTQCGMDKLDPDSPYIAFRGSENPIVTILVDGVSRKEDVAGEIAAAGYTSGLYEMVEKIVAETGVDPERDVRWLSVTRCANRHSKQVNLSTKANWCRYHVVQDLMLHPPRLIIPVGTVALGSLSHKSNAFDWQGKILTYRGWPDDWLTNPKFMLPRMSPLNVEEMVVGHPVFGPPPSHDFRIPIYPIQSPKLIYFQNNKSVTTKWKRVFMEGIKLATQDIKALNYHRAWYRVVTARDEVIEGLKFLINNPGLMVSFDTETTGLKQFAKGQKIVFIMFRWKHPKTGEPMSLGFPWDYPESDLYPHIADLTPWVLEALYASRLCGHNLVFDLLFCAATLKGCDINRLAVNADYDTWHMAYTARQQRGALGLERIAYDYVPDLAGYEEEMTLLIDLFKELLHPGADKGGHYARCPKEYWNSHLVPYVMGDVEVCYQSRDKLEELLRSRNVYPFPLAHPTQRGYFTTFTPPSRHWVYESIMAPANKLLTKMMARGMFVNVASVRRFEAAYPARIKELTDAFASTKKPNIADWIKQKETMIRDKGDNKAWEFDLENKEVLKDLLFGFLELPIQRLTKAGKKLFGDRPEDLTNVSREELYPFAAVDKFTLNKLCADHEELRPLLDYRKAYKVYTTYVRPLRNCFDSDIDKKRRDEIPHLWIRKEDRPIYKDEIFSADDCGGDSCIHATFKLTGTRGGRLSCCLPLTVRVATSRGLIPIGSVEVGDKIQTSTGVGTVLVSERTGKKPVLRLHLSTGILLECSAEHRFFVNGAWKQAGEIAVGDWLYQCGRIGISTVRRAPLRKTACIWTTKPCKNLHYPRVLDNDTAFLLGHYIAEGCLGFNKTRVSKNKGLGGNQSGSYPQARAYKRQYPTDTPVPYRVIVAYGHTEKALAARIAELYRVKFGIVGKHVKIGKTRSPAYVMNSKALAAWLTAQGCGGCSFEKQVPSAVFVSPLSVIRAFLRGLFEGDGGSTDGIPKLNTDSRVLAVQVQTLLHMVGICSSFTRQRRVTGKYRYFVRVLAQSRKDGRMLFWSKRKQSAVRSAKEQRKANSYIALDANRKVRATSLLSIEHPVAKWALDANARSVRVLRVEKADPVEMCDISVDNGEFLVNGIRTHNSDPNLQQLPSDSDIKEMFVSRFGSRGCIYAGDLSQIELRLLAAACGDQNMMRAYFENLDLHTLTTSRIFKLPYETFSKEHMEGLQKAGKGDEAKKLELKRRIGKTCNFLTGYGGGAFGLQTTLANSKIYLSLEECESILESFFSSYPALKEYLGIYKSFILRTGCAVSLLGRVRFFEEIGSEDREAVSKALRAGCNHLIQATASDMMLICLVVIEDLMRKANLESMLVSTVHDSLAIDAVRTELPQIHNIVYSVLNNIPEVLQLVFGPDYDTSWMIVPFAGDCEVGVDYLHLNKIPTKGAVDWDSLLKTDE